MTLAVSNIAWSYSNRLAAYALLKEHGFTGLEVAPALLFAEEADPLQPSSAGFRARIEELQRAGLRLVSMQSLLFGVEGAALFGSSDELERLQGAMQRVIAFAGRAGIPNLVFGSPRQRVVPANMPIEAVLTRARDVFGRLGDLAAANNTVLALEPNPAQYGANFMTDVAETLRVVEAINHPAITLNFDVGALHMAGEYHNLHDQLTAARRRVSHVHLSEPYLAVAPASADDAATLLLELAAIDYKGAVSIEMKAVPGDEIGTVRQAVNRLSEASRRVGYRK
jgi:sugar phosphate isomerase/epimerase